MRKFFTGFVYAFRGIRVAFAEQRNLKVQLAVSLITIAAGFYYHVTNVEWLALVIIISLVISLEMINSSLESLVDLVTSERKPLAGKVKDIAAGAVLIAAVFSVVVGFLIFKKYIF